MLREEHVMLCWSILCDEVVLIDGMTELVKRFMMQGMLGEAPFSADDMESACQYLNEYAWDIHQFTYETRKQVAIWCMLEEVTGKGWGADSEEVMEGGASC